jgi:hypothetical protein
VAILVLDRGPGPRATATLLAPSDVLAFGEAAGLFTTPGVVSGADAGGLGESAVVVVANSNEPAGFTLVHDTQFVGFTTGTPGVNGTAVDGVTRYAASNQGAAVTDTVAPYNGATVLRVLNANGSNQGSGYEHLCPGTGSSTRIGSLYAFTELYVSCWVRVDAGYRTPTGSGVNKLFHIEGLCDAVPSGNGGGSLVVPSISSADLDATTGTIGLQLRFQNMSTVNGGLVSFNGNRVTILRGVWSKLEVYLKYNTGASADGIAKMWVDGVLRTNRTDLTYRNGGTKKWCNVKLNPTYGGTIGTQITGDQPNYFADWKTSGA